MTREDVEKVKDAANNIDRASEILSRAGKNDFSIYIGEYSIPLNIKVEISLYEDVYDVVREYLSINSNIIKNMNSTGMADSEHSCDDCRYRIPMGIEENDRCSGSHPVEFAAGDFLCNRWEKG